MLLSQTDLFGRDPFFARDPFAGMRQLQSDLNQLLSGAGTTGYPQAHPPVNLWLGEKSLVVAVELPGVSTDDIDLALTEDEVTIRGKRPDAADGGDVAWRRRERAAGSFSRSIDLPFRIDPERVEARCSNGVLEIEMQRPEADLPRKIEVKSG